MASNVYAVRVHELAGDDTKRRLLDLCEGLTGSYVFARETDAARTHFQGWVRTDIKPQAFRVRVKKAFPECKGNKGYSITAVKDFEAYQRYILKGADADSLPDVVCFSGLELGPAQIKDAHAAYWESKTVKKPAKSQPGIVSQVREWADAQEWDDIDEHREDVARYVCDVITGANKPLNLSYARFVYNAVMYQRSGRFQKMFVDKIVSEY